MTTNPDTLPDKISSVAASRLPTTRVMKIIRRIHMFTGLFMLPWVLVYGISALSFNHGSWFYPANPKSATPHDIRQLPRSFWDDATVKSVASAHSLAENILADINQQAATGGQEQWRLVPDKKPRFSENLVSSGTKGKDRVEMRVNLNAHNGTLELFSPKKISPSEPNGKDSAPANQTRRFNSVTTPVLDDLWLAALESKINQTLNSTNTAPASLRVIKVPEFIFTAEAEGRRWNIHCDLATGEVFARPANLEWNWLASTTWFMARLHVSRGYPSDGSLTIRWWWALIVDAMAFIMLLWGVSGAAMWWQMKGQRKWGFATLALCGLTGWLIWSGMKHAMQ
jgi:hypothetical protein